MIQVISSGTLVRAMGRASLDGDYAQLLLMSDATSAGGISMIMRNSWCICKNDTRSARCVNGRAAGGSTMLTTPISQCTTKSGITLVCMMIVARARTDLLLSQMRMICGCMVWQNILPIDKHSVGKRVCASTCKWEPRPTDKSKSSDDSSHSSSQLHQGTLETTGSPPRKPQKAATQT